MNLPTDKPQQSTSRTDVTKALEARQDATDAATKLIDDGFPQAADTILNALHMLDRTVIKLERELAEALAREKTWSDIAVKNGESLGQALEKIEKMEDALEARAPSPASAVTRTLARNCADNIISDYKEHYGFPTQGESHMHDCIMDALAGLLPPEAAAQMPKEPPLSLLVSMALRVNHGFGLDDERSQQVQISDMRKVYEEVSGHGFYSLERTEYYRAMVRGSTQDSQPGPERNK